MIPRLAAGTIFVAALCIALGISVPDIADEPLVRPGPWSRQPAPIPTRGDAANGELVREIPLHSADLRALASADELRLTIGTYDTTPSVASAALTLGPACAFRGLSQSLGENSPLRLLRAAGCTAPDGPGPVMLTITFNATSSVDARAAIWTATTDGAVPLVLSVDRGSRTLAVVGRRIVLRSEARTRRADLLAFMWDLSHLVIWSLALAGATLFVAGGMFVRRSRSMVTSAASFAIAGGLALCYAVTVPPLQAPDEPDHLLSFAALTQRQDLAAATSAWARRIHFYRTTFLGADERFTPKDREQPFDRDWPPLDVFAENVARRSSSTTRLWQLLAPIVPANPAHALLLFRIADAIIFAAAIGAGAALLSASGVRILASGIVVVLLGVPALPFFGMHMSEIAFTLAAFILIGYLALVVAANGSSRYTGVVLGVAMALLGAGPRNGWPALLIIVGLCAGRIAARVVAPERAAADTWWFWGGAAAPGLVLYGSRLLWVPAPFYEQWQLGGFDPRGGVSTAQFIVALCGGAILGALAERVAGYWPAFRPAAIGARAACALGAAGILATLVWSIFAPLPQLLGIGSGPMPTAGAYVWSVLRTIATAARVREFDFLTWTSLLGGFGWLNPILPATAIAAVTIVLSLAAAGTLVRFAREQDGRAAVITICVVAGIAASIAAAALSSFGLTRNIHGRYLLGGCVVGMCLLVAPFLLEDSRGVTERARSAALYALICALHGYALNFLLEKYFG
jgi:hypothetical protein